MVALLLALSTPAFAGRKQVVLDLGYLAPLGSIHIAQGDGDGSSYDTEGGGGGVDVSIRPREAARIAKRSMPGSRVLKVKLLPSGIYAVTLRGNGELTRVMVDGQTGEIL